MPPKQLEMESCNVGYISKLNYGWYAFINICYTVHSYQYCRTSKLSELIGLKERFHPKLKTFYKLQLCLHNQQFVLFLHKTDHNISDSISGPELTHPEARTAPSIASTSPSRDRTLPKLFYAQTLIGNSPPWEEKNHERTKTILQCYIIKLHHLQSLHLHSEKLYYKSMRF